MGMKASKPLLRRFGSSHTVVATVYNHKHIMPSEHHIVPIVRKYPHYNRPLGLTALALARSVSDGISLTAIDIGANIGETAALIELWHPNVFSYLCIEPEPDLAEMCKANHDRNTRVHVLQAFMGEDEGAAVQLQDDGRANPSTVRTSDLTATDTQRLVRLDTAALPFAQEYGRLDLIKVDTEGYDFSVLRSGSRLLRDYQPALFFEWFPSAIKQVGEDMFSGFEFLQQSGYRYFVFFTNFGDYYCYRFDPELLFLRSLASITETQSLVYFDVFASTSEDIANILVELSIEANGKTLADRTNLITGIEQGRMERAAQI